MAGVRSRTATAWAAVSVAALLLCVAATLSHRAEGGVELEGIFDTLHRPVPVHASLGGTRGFTTFQRPGYWKDALVQKRHRLEQEKALLEDKKHRLVKQLEAERNWAVDKTWRDAIALHRERLDRSIGRAKRVLREGDQTVRRQRIRRESGYEAEEAAWERRERERQERVKALEGLVRPYQEGGVGADGGGDARVASQRESVSSALQALERQVGQVRDGRRRAELDRDVEQLQRSLARGGGVE